MDLRFGNVFVVALRKAVLKALRITDYLFIVSIIVLACMAQLANALLFSLLGGSRYSHDLYMDVDNRIIARGVEVVLYHVEHIVGVRFHMTMVRPKKKNDKDTAVGVVNNDNNKN